MKILFIVILLLVSWVSAARGLPGGVDANGVPIMNDENGYVRPFKIFDNVYYIGDNGVSSYIIKTSEGLILIDSLEGGFGPWLAKGVSDLGLNPTDIKYIVITHGHSDHVGGAHYIQQQYGSKVVMTARDHELAISQAETSAVPMQFNHPRVDIIATDDSAITLGDTTIRMYITPGHTAGCLSLDFWVKNGGDKHRAFVVGGMGTNFSGVEMAQNYLHSVLRIRGITSSTPVEVSLTNHPHMNQLFERRDGLAKKSGQHSFVDRDGFVALLQILEKRGVEKLAEERQVTN